MGNQGSLDNTPYYAYQIIAQASRSVSSRSVAEKRSRAFLASYFPPTSSTTASKSPTSFVWPRACACSNAPTNQASDSASVSSTNAESNVLHPAICSCSHCGSGKLFVLRER